MEVSIERDKTIGSFGDLIYRVYVQLFLNDSKVDILTVPIEVLSNLVEKYFTTVRSASSTLKKEKIPFRNTGSVPRTIGTSFKSASLSDLRTINIFTIDKFANTTIGRTIIELDADIITLFSQKVLDRNIHSGFRLHSFSVYLITHYLKYLMEKISGDLRHLSTAIKVASFIPFGISIYLAMTINPSEIALRFTPLIISTVVTPLLYKYIPRMIIRMMLGQFFKEAST